MTAKQIALPIPEQPCYPPSDPDRFGLMVDEVRANAVGTGMNWWLPYAARFESRGLSRTLAISIAGALMEYGPFERDDVDFMQAHMVEHGMHPKTLIIRPWTAELPDCTHAGACKRCGRSHGHPEKRASRAA